MEKEWQSRGTWTNLLSWKHQNHSSEYLTKNFEPTKNYILYLTQQQQWDTRRGIFVIQSTRIPMGWVTHKLENNSITEVLPQEWGFWAPCQSLQPGSLTSGGAPRELGFERLQSPLELCPWRVSWGLQWPPPSISCGPGCDAASGHLRLFRVPCIHWVEKCWWCVGGQSCEAHGEAHPKCHIYMRTALLGTPVGWSLQNKKL